MSDYTPPPIPNGAQLNDNSGVIALNAGARTLNDSAGSPIANWTSGGIAIPGSATHSTLRVGGLEVQSFGANGNEITDNLYYNGSDWKYRANGFGSVIDYGVEGIKILTAPSGVAGATATLTLRMVIGNTGQIVLTALPTSSAGLPSGSLYTTAGAVMQVP